jgi:outer membrane protein OmpA-like peptidoglycan-associated protein
MRICNFLLAVCIVHCTHAEAQGLVKLEPDASGCVDSKTLPKLPMCRIDNCEAKDDDQRAVPVREDEKGSVVTAAIDGASRSVMYECREGTTPATIVQQSLAALKAAAIPVLYQYVGQEGTVTARKGDLWMLLEAAARYYTLTELKAAPPDFESLTEATEFANGIERYGHVDIYGIHFQAARAEFSTDSETALREIAVMLESHPEWRLRIECHTDNTGTKMANMTLSARRASAVAAWLAGHGIKRTRMETTGMGDIHPIADNATAAGRAKNERVDLIRIAASVEH